MIFGFLVNMENTIAIFLSHPSGPFPSKMMRCPWILCFDLLPMQYTNLTHEIRRFLVYIFLGLNLRLLKDQRFVYMIRIRYRRVKTRVTLVSTLGERLRTKIPYSRRHTCKDNCDKIISKFIRHMFNYLFKDTRIVKNQLNYPSFNCYPAMHT